MSAGLRQRYRERFVAELGERGFGPAEPARDGGNGDVGQVQTPVGPQRIRIVLPEAFPYRRPVVYPLGGTTERRHQVPGNGELCLWPSEGAGWDPADSVDSFLARVGRWFAHDADGSWPADDRPPDLHLSIGRVRDRLLVTGDDWPPAPGTWGRFAVWDDDVIITLAANARLGNDSVRLTAEHPLVEQYGAKDGHGIIGLWFRLAQEPTAPKKLGEILEIVAAQGVETPEQLRYTVRGLLSHKIRKPERLFFALGYPDPDASRVQEERWLFVDAEISVGADWSGIVNAPVFGYESAPGDVAALRRRLGPTAEGIASARIAVFGVGSLGSSVAMLLAKSGVGGLDLYDGDRFRPGHARRHALNVHQAGFKKALATGFVIRRYAPDVEVTSHDTTWQLTTLTAAIASATVVVDATATPTFNLLLADLCRDAGVPLITLVAHLNGRVGRVQVTRPGIDPCPQCYRQAEDSQMNPSFDPDDSFVETGCGSPSSYANAADLEATANVAARAVLRLVRGTQEANQIFVVNEGVLGGEAPLDREGIRLQTNSRHPDCTLCGT